jgi:hypothetical protein
MSTLTMCSTKCLDDDASRAMSMVSRGLSLTTNGPTMLSAAFPVCDHTEDITTYLFFKKVLQRGNVEWKPWHDLQVWEPHMQATAMIIVCEESAGTCADDLGQATTAKAIFRAAN